MKWFLLFMVLLFVPFSSAIYCLQETATNRTTVSCGWLTNGTAAYTDASGGDSSWRDGDYSTGYTAVVASTYSYVNYSLPMNVMNGDDGVGFWSVRDGFGYANLSIPSNCSSNATNNTFNLQFRVGSGVTLGYSWECDVGNGTWNVLRSGVVNAAIYEEAVYWHEWYAMAFFGNISSVRPYVWNGTNFSTQNIGTVAGNLSVFGGGSEKLLSNLKANIYIPLSYQFFSVLENTTLPYGRAFVLWNGTNFSYYNLTLNLNASNNLTAFSATSSDSCAEPNTGRIMVVASNMSGDVTKDVEYWIYDSGSWSYGQLDVKHSEETTNANWDAYAVSCWSMNYETPFIAWGVKAETPAGATNNNSQNVTELFIWNGTGTTAPFRLAQASNVRNKRSFDLAYDPISGIVMAYVSTGASNNSTWYNVTTTSWSSGTTLDCNPSGSQTYSKINSFLNPLTGEIMFGCSDSLSDLSFAKKAGLATTLSTGVRIDANLDVTNNGYCFHWINNTVSNKAGVALYLTNANGSIAIRFYNTSGNSWVNSGGTANFTPYLDTFSRSEMACGKDPNFNISDSPTYLIIGSYSPGSNNTMATFFYNLSYGNTPNSQGLEKFLPPGGATFPMPSLAIQNYSIMKYYSYDYTPTNFNNSLMWRHTCDNTSTEWYNATYNVTNPKFGYDSTNKILGSASCYFASNASASDTYINWTGVSGVNQGTLNLWIRDDTGGDQRVAISLYNATSGSLYRIQELNATPPYVISGELGPYPVFYVWNVSVSTNTWMMVTSVFNQTGMFIYVNATLKNLSVQNWTLLQGPKWCFGTNCVNANDLWAGQLDEISFHNRSLSQLEIRDLFLNYTSGTDPFNQTAGPAPDTNCYYPGSGDMVCPCATNYTVASNYNILGWLNLTGTGLVSSAYDLNATKFTMASNCKFALSASKKFSIG